MHLPLQTLAAVSLLTLVDARDGSPRRSGTTVSLHATQYGSVFDAPVTIGNQTFQLLVDTGSSDTYVMAPGLTCINATDNQIIPEADCLYSNKTFRPSSSYKNIPSEMFGTQYGAGLASGAMAYEKVSIGNITAEHQKIGIANVSNPMGDGLNSGLLGLAYPAITAAHPANHTSNETYWFDRSVYSPLVFTMHQNHKIDPYFSIALARTPQNESRSFGGYLTLGGLPPVAHSEFTTVPVEIMKGVPANFTSGKKTRAWWTTTIGGVTYGTKGNMTTDSKPWQAFFDSGNPLSILPSAVVDPIHALFSSRPVWNDEIGGYIVDCATKVPEFGLTIGNKTFFHHGADLIYQTSAGVCMSSFVPSELVGVQGLALNIIGVAFFKSVVAVFDFGQHQMKFAPVLGAGNGSETSVGHLSSPADTSAASTISAGRLWGGFSLSLTALAVLMT
ncbi:hypothetical protein N7492_003120 [Penicillium capsulatum]|uniref:penicillopepsin n=1 Tax=Penicillium capsulatum TaxID=69766 RepID=A0A9W9IN20_9EURO|nr:hypothetical protein N7492_003120 [Penicillium capsulatum]KAJ6122290.1 hypothetical protein N7512_004755 [Penicillium capsulatum]